MTKPNWMANEGYWRILMILRFAAGLPFIVFAAVILFYAQASTNPYRKEDMLANAIGFFAAGVAAFFIVHLLAWLIVWVRAGFAQSKGKQ